jgi:hypothetical protein
MPGKRGPTISQKVRREVRKRALERPRGPRGALAVELQDLIQRWGEPVPSQETLEKIISEIRNSDDDQDRLWSLVSLPSYPVPPEAIPYVLKAWARAIEKDNPITIREALWVARLYAIFQANEIGYLKSTYEKGKVDLEQHLAELNRVTVSILNDLDTLDTLLEFAQVYAVNEKILTREENYPDRREEILSYWQNDAETYGVLPYGDLPASDLIDLINSELNDIGNKVKKQRGSEAKQERTHSKEIQE